MKVIGIIDDRDYGRDGVRYVCEVNHNELTKMLGNTYGDNALKPLKVGETLDLGAGYDFRASIVDTATKAAAAIETLDKNMPRLAEFLLRVATITPPSTEER